MKANGKLVGLVFSLIFGAGAVLGFFWLWTQLNSESTQSAATQASGYQQIEISSVKKEAEDILSDKQKYAEIPVKVVPEKMGKDNPFK
jgi:predicted negative regulator of RcsB-dependent stress response